MGWLSLRPLADRATEKRRQRPQPPRLAGYNAEHDDWFFTKHLLSGELDKAPNGMQLEGRLPGCQSCHVVVQTNDYLYTGQLGAGN